MQVHNYTGECSSFSEPSVLKWLRAFQGIGSEGRHQEGQSQTPWEGKWIPLLGIGQSVLWDVRHPGETDLRNSCPPTLLPTGTVSGPAPTVPVNQLAIPASKPHYSGVWTPCSSVWWLVIQSTDYQQLGFQFGPRLVQHIQLHFLSIKC